MKDMAMIDLARATITVPEVTPDTRRGPDTGDGDAGERNGGTGCPGTGGWAGGWAGAPRSALEGLRALAKPRAGGGRGGRRPTRPPRGEGSGRIDLRNTWQILAGSVLVPLGVVFILMSWYGAAHTAYVQQQIPYLVSGSFAGLGCLILGGLLYWAHWLYRIYDQADLHHEEQLKAFEAALRAIVQGGRAADTDPRGTPKVGSAPVASGAVASGAVGSGFGASGSAVSEPGPWDPMSTSASDRSGYQSLMSSPASSSARISSPSYVVTPSGSVYHVASCPVIAHHTEGLRVLGAAGVADMEPCRICLPSRG
jgi:hypothetical protein